MSDSLSRVKEGYIGEGVTLGSNGGYAVEADPSLVGELPHDSPIMRDVGTRFSLAGFNERRVPITVGQFGGDALAGVSVGTRIESLPIKFPGSDEYRVPSELASIGGIIAVAASVEAKINPKVNDDYYAYLTLQRTNTVPGVNQRAPELHGDDIQGPRIQPKQPVGHGYVLVDRDPTNFFTAPVDVTDLDPDVHNLAEVFARRVDRLSAVAIRIGNLYLFDGYCLHQGRNALVAGPRGFFRLFYATRPYDRLGNSVNKLFEQEYAREGWKFQPRPRPTTLICAD